MKEKFRKAIILMFLPVLINVLITFFYCINIGQSEFKGYLSGTVLSLLFSLIWILMIRKVSLSNIMVLFALSLGSFPVKLIVFAIFAFGSLFIFQINQIYFGFAFLIGTIFNLIIEVWFITSINNMNKKKNKTA